MTKEGGKTKKPFLGRLTVKFILIFTAILVGAFAVISLAVSLSAKYYVDSYVLGAANSMRDDIDVGVCEIFDEVTYNYETLTAPETEQKAAEMDAAITYAARRIAFLTMIDSVGVNLANVIDIGFKDEKGYYSYGGMPEPRQVVFDAASDFDRAYLGDYERSCVIIAMRTKPDYPLDGTFVFYLLESALEEVYGAMSGENAYSFIVRSDGFVLSHENKALVGKSVVFDNVISLDETDTLRQVAIEGEKKVVVLGDLKYSNSRFGFDCMLAIVMDYSFYYGGYDTLIIILISVASGFFVVGVVLAIARSKSIADPVEYLSRSIDEIYVSDKTRKIARRGDEIYQLEQNYDEMIDRIFTLMKREKDDLETQRKLELDALQMQINPHFLYNTLDAVVWIARINKQPEIENLVVNLAGFFRLSLHRGDRFVTVNEELEIVRHYFEIERTRFPDRAELIIGDVGDIGKYKTLKLLLQPIVENAIKYAFPHGGGKVNISVRQEDEYLVYEVRDNGVGFDAPEDIISAPKSDDGAFKKNDSGALSGYGLYNVNRRIKLEYGEDCGLAITSVPGQGTTVKIKIEKRI